MILNKQSFKKVDRLFEKAVKRNARLSQESDIEFLENATNSELFIIEVVMNHHSIKELILDLRENIKFLEVNEIPKELKNIGINEKLYYQYVYENAIIRIITVIDVLLKFINLSFRIGLRDFDVTENRLLSNTIYKNSFAFKAVEKLLKDFKSLKLDRHSIVHKAEFSDEKLEKLKRKFLLRDLLKDSPQTLSYINFSKDEAHDDLINTVLSYHQKLNNHFIIISDTCTEIILFHYNALKKSNNKLLINGN